VRTKGGASLYIDIFGIYVGPMSRIARVAPGGLVYHVLNRANGRLRLFKKDDDFLAFEEVLALAHERLPIRILDWVMMSNRWSRRAGSALAGAGRGTERLSPLADADPRPALETRPRRGGTWASLPGSVQELSHPGRWASAGASRTTR
jgi:hypothetical protein